MNPKKRKVIDYANLPPELKNVVNRMYPNGFKNHLITVPSPNGLTKAFTVDTGDVLYLVKVNDFYLRDADDVVDNLDVFNPDESDLID